MADPRGFITTPVQHPERRPVGERVKDWKEVYPQRALLPIIVKQAGRCMDCGIPFCHNGCPLGNLIPEWNDLVWREDWAEAIERLHATKNVEVSIIDKAWDAGLVKPAEIERHSGKTVAVIGSGPAGLAAAQQLTRA